LRTCVWITEYAGLPYQEVAAKARAHLERLADLYATPAREAKLIETDFWEVGWRAGEATSSPQSRICHCLKPMHFAVDSSAGERLIRLPLHNDPEFQRIYRHSRDAVQVKDDAEFEGQDGILGRLNRFMRDLKR
jgi:hypothetical protein